MKLLEAILILSGMIIGVGMFGIPYAFSRAGFWLGTAELIILTGVVLTAHILYGEIVLRTPAYHRLPGYVRIYLGKRAALVSWISAIAGIIGTLLAYIILGAFFLHTIWGGIAESFFAFLVVLFGALITYFPLRREAAINGALTALLVLFIIAISIFLLPEINKENILGFNLNEIFLPYGIIFFALAGGVVVPDLTAFLGRKRESVRLAIIIGTILPAVLYFIFALVMVGTLGLMVSEDAITSLLSLAGEPIVKFGALIGLLAAFTSYITLHMSFQALLRLDLKINKFTAWFTALSVPLFLYFIGFRNFIMVISIIGALGVGIDTALILASYHNLRSKTNSASSSLYIGEIILYFLITIGIISTLWYTQ